VARPRSLFFELSPLSSFAAVAQRRIGRVHPTRIHTPFGPRRRVVLSFSRRHHRETVSLISSSVPDFHAGKPIPMRSARYWSGRPFLPRAVRGDKELPSPLASKRPLSPALVSRVRRKTSKPSFLSRSGAGFPPGFAFFLLSLRRLGEVFPSIDARSFSDTARVRVEAGTCSPPISCAPTLPAARPPCRSKEVLTPHRGAVSEVPGCRRSEEKARILFFF